MAATVATSHATTTGGGNASAAAMETKIKVAKDLREKLKRARAARGLLQDLEEEIRSFVESWAFEAKANPPRRQRGASNPQHQEDDGLVLVDKAEDSPDSEDEEIVFVGRKRQATGVSIDQDTAMLDKDGGHSHLPRDAKLIVDSPADDRGAAFTYVFFLYNFVLSLPSHPSS